MDNTDFAKRIILVSKKTNRKTGETITRTKPKVEKKKKKVIARGKGEHTVGAVLISRLQPFKFAMITGLKRRGISTSGLDLKTIIVLYYNEFATLDGLKKDKPIPITEFINNPAFKIKPSSNLTGDINEARNNQYFADITYMVEKVINIFKNARDKYDALIIQDQDPKSLLTDEEITQAKAVILVENELLKKAESDHFVKATDIHILIRDIIAVLIAAWIIKNLL